jgi:hypothetical protein
MVDRLTDAISRTSDRRIPVGECRRIAGLVVDEFTMPRPTGPDRETLLAFARDIRTLSLEGARSGGRTASVDRGALLDALDRHGLRHV